ncbi:hypothetical protein DVH05_004900 [Phytophthora capsici]|nr:hypothetical protein DVH05_004900 [Phytophthora capsici]
MKQIIVDEPHKGAYGKVMERSQVVADALNASDEFSRDNLTAKTAQNRFSLLLECPQNNKKAARGSGITEEYELKHELHDEALLLVDENRHEQDKAKAEARAKPQAAEKAGEEVRELAIQRHRRRGLPGDDSTVKPQQVCQACGGAAGAQGKGVRDSSYCRGTSP